MYISKKSKKSKNIKKHFLSRCLERVGYPVSSRELVKKIQNNELEFVRKTSNTRSIFKYINPLLKKDYYIIYDKNRKLVVTIY